MTRSFDGLRQLFSTLWRASAPLTAAALVLLGLLAASLAGLLLDPRVITGAPAWLKPAKFALSTAVYSLTLAWFFTFLPDWPRLRRFAGAATAAVFLLEVVLIDVQAWRGTTSHFNIGTVLDAVVFGIMGTAIAFQTLVGVAVAVALWRQPFVDRAIGWAMRLGLTLSLVGATVGGIMTRPTGAQLDAARGHRSNDYRRRPHRRRTGRRARPGWHRLEPGTRGLARPAFRRSACNAGAAVARPDPAPPTVLRSDRDPTGDFERHQLCPAVRGPALASAPRRIAGRA